MTTPFKVEKRKGPRPYKIVRLADNKVVGSSISLAKAKRSIGHRMSGEPRRKKREVDRK